MPPSQDSDPGRGFVFTTMSTKIAVIGGGSWATAIVKMLSDNLAEKEIFWWMRCAESVAHVQKYKHNPRYISSVEIKVPVDRVSTDLKSIITAADWVLLCVPAAFLKEALAVISPEELKGKKIISAIKGIVPDENLIVGEFMNQSYGIPLEDILVISGPNAGGKTVAMKTIGLIQLMAQSGLLVPVGPGTRLGVFKQLMIQMGDAQSLEFELSTYSSHLMHMKTFLEAANGRTLFFVDEMGSGSDPDLGGAFAEVMLQEFLRKHSMGVVTTHYLNLKVMAGRTPGLVNGAMAFDEKTLSPLYKLQVGKPGSSYTFAIAQRIGLDKMLIERAKRLVNEDHVRLDKLLHRSEKELAELQQKQREVNKLLLENQRLQSEMERVLDKEKHRQEIALLREQNRIAAERWKELKDLERKLKLVLQDWRKNPNKEKAMKEMAQVLFPKRPAASKEKNGPEASFPHEELTGELAVGDTVLVRQTGRHGQVIEFKGKSVVVRIGKLPMQVSRTELMKIRLTQTENSKKTTK